MRDEILSAVRRRAMEYLSNQKKPISPLKFTRSSTYYHEMIDKHLHKKGLIEYERKGFDLIPKQEQLELWVEAHELANKLFLERILKDNL